MIDAPIMVGSRSWGTRSIFSSNLLSEARAGNADAHAEILHLLRVFARELCRGGGPAGAPELDWEDVAQESGRRLFERSIDNYRGSGSESSYLYSIVKSTVINMSRSGERRRRREKAAGWDAVVESPPHESRFEVHRILKELTGACRDLVVRVFFYGATYQELSLEMELEESSVRSKLSRCVQRARTIAMQKDPT